MPSGSIKTAIKSKNVALEIPHFERIYRREVQIILQCGIQTVFDHVKAGRLRELGKDERGYSYFDPMSVCELVVSKNGNSVYQRAIDLFVSRETLLTCCAALNLPIDKVRELHRAWTVPLETKESLDSEAEDEESKRRMAQLDLTLQKRREARRRESNGKGNKK